MTCRAGRHRTLGPFRHLLGFVSFLNSILVASLQKWAYWTWSHISCIFDLILFLLKPQQAQLQKFSLDLRLVFSCLWNVSYHFIALLFEVSFCYSTCINRKTQMNCLNWVKSPYTVPSKSWNCRSIFKSFPDQVHILQEATCWLPAYLSSVSSHIIILVTLLYTLVPCLDFALIYHMEIHILMVLWMIFGNSKTV